MVVYQRYFFSPLRVCTLIAIGIFLQGNAKAIALDGPMLNVSAPSGNYSFPLTPNEAGLTSGSSTIDGDLVSWSLDVADPNHLVFASGSFSVTNNSSGERAYGLELQLPLNAPITNTVVGGTGTITLNANANGGFIKCAPNASALLRHSHDESPAATMFYCPFVMSASGASTSSTNAIYGAPIPSLAAVDASTHVVIAFRPLLSDGDKATAAVTAIVHGDEVVVVPPEATPEPEAGEDPLSLPDGDSPPEETPPGDQDAPIPPTATPAPTPEPSEAGALAIERLKARAPRVKVKITREGVAASDYSTRLSVAGHRASQTFDCMVGEIAPGAASVVATLRLDQRVRGKLVVSAEALAESFELSASHTGKVKRVRSLRRGHALKGSCPVKLLKVK